MRFDKLFVFALFAGTAAAAIAQAVPVASDDRGPTVSSRYPIALSLNYTAMISNAPPGTCGCFLLQGGSGEGVFHLWRNIAAVAKVSGNRVGLVPQSQQGLSLVTYTAGPRYSFRTTRRITTYGQFLVGGVHGFDTYLPVNNSQSTGAGNSLALAPAGGVEIGINNWLSVKAAEGEYLITHLPNSVNAYQRNLRASAGVVFRFSSARLNR
jgi:hypothetical protein